MSRRGFTILEISVVILIIAALLGMSIPAVNAMRSRLAIQNTRALVSQIVGATCGYDGGKNSVTILGSGATRRLWDFDNDGLLDGEPSVDPGFSGIDRNLAAAAGYHGVVGHLSIPGIRLDEYKRPLDRWYEPLRIAVGGEAYGGAGLGIWSSGPDRVPFTADDIKSWGNDADD